MPGKLAKITKGVDFNFFEKVTVDVAAFPEFAQVFFDFRGQQGFSLINEGASVVEYSFNGNTVHGDLTPSSPSESLFFDFRRVSGIWFQTSGAPTIIRVEAWAAK